MALGKEIGSFSMKETSSTVTPGSGNALNLQMNFQGQASGEAGEGLLVGTMTVEYEPSMKSGTWGFCGMTVLNSGGGVTVNGQDTWVETGHLKFRCHGTGKNSDGSTNAVEFDMDADADGVQTMTGKSYELS